MYCSKCGKEINNVGKFCNHCGAAITENAPAENASPVSRPIVGNGGGNYSSQPPRMAMPPTYLWQSIVVTFLCCMPFGIPAIVYASKVEKLFLGGDYIGAEKASSNAKGWMVASFVSGFVAVIIYIIFIAAGYE
jgi:hypothetical protein